MSLLTEIFRSKATVSNLKFFQTQHLARRDEESSGCHRSEPRYLWNWHDDSLERNRVYAVCRKANDEMRKSKFECIIENVDIGKDDCKKNLQNSFKDVSIDILIHNSGILDVDDLDTLDLDSVRRQFEINSLGPLRVVQALKSKMKVGDSYIGLMTSQMGSIADNSSGGYYGYRMSKCALNMAGKSLALDLKGTSSVQLLHPGFVRTDMTKDFGSGARPVGESVDGIMEIIESGYG